MTDEKQCTRTGEGAFVAVFDDDPNACYLTDLYGRFVDSNRAFEDLTGYDRRDLRGKTSAECALMTLDQLPTHARALVRNVEGEPSGPDAYSLRRKDGFAVQVEVRSMPIRMSGELLVLGIAHRSAPPGEGDE